MEEKTRVGNQGLRQQSAMSLRLCTDSETVKDNSQQGTRIFRSVVLCGGLYRQSSSRELHWLRDG